MRYEDTRVEIVTDSEGMCRCYFLDHGDIIASSWERCSSVDIAIEVARKVWRNAPIYLVKLIKEHAEE